MWNQPSLERLRGRLGLLVVALHDVVAADDDLADVLLARRQPLVVVVDDPHLDAPDRLADREHLALLGVDVERRRARPTPTGRSPRGSRSRGTSPRTRGSSRRGSPRRRRRRRAATTGRGRSRSVLSSAKYIVGTPEKIVQRCFSIASITGGDLEARHQHHRPAVADGHVEHAGQPEDVEQRQHRHADVVVAELEQLAGDGAVHEQLEVRQLGALGLAGGAAGVEQHRGVVRVERRRCRGCRRRSTARRSAWCPRAARRCRAC